MALTLRPADQAWGGAELKAGEPPLEEHRDVYALPFKRDGRWGLFDRDDRVIEAAVDRGWPDARANACIPESSTTRSAVADALPDDVEYVYGGVYQPHFGHYLLETLSRLWVLIDGLKPHQRLLMHGPADPQNWWLHNYVRGTLGALGVSLDSIVHVSAPVRIARVLVPGQAFRVNAYAYPAYRRMCHAIGERLAGPGPRPRNVRPVFLSKARLTDGVTGIVNEQALIDELERNGVEIVFPEQLNMIGKIDLFLRRKVVAGWATSGQHVSVFAPPVDRMEMLTGGLALNSNCVLVDRVNANETRYWDAGLEEVRLEHSTFLTNWQVSDIRATAAALLDRL